MSNKAGNLLWRRMQVTELAGGATTIDTGLQQQNTAFGNSSEGEPGLGKVQAPPGPSGGPGDISRIQVIPLAPTTAWANVTHSEPFLDPATGTIKVTFTNSSSTIALLNVLFWDPDTKIGPGEADYYNATIG